MSAVSYLGHEGACSVSPSVFNEPARACAALVLPAGRAATRVSERPSRQIHAPRSCVPAQPGTLWERGPGGHGAEAVVQNFPSLAATRTICRFQWKLSSGPSPHPPRPNLQGHLRLSQMPWVLRPVRPGELADGFPRPTPCWTDALGDKLGLRGLRGRRFLPVAWRDDLFCW